MHYIPKLDHSPTPQALTLALGVRAGDVPGVKLIRISAMPGFDVAFGYGERGRVLADRPFE